MFRIRNQSARRLRSSRLRPAPECAKEGILGLIIQRLFGHSEKYRIFMLHMADQMIFDLKRCGNEFFA